jgi:hypothetical protein
VKQFLEAPVHKQVPTVGVLKEDHGWRIVQNRLEPLFASRTSDFRALVFGSERDVGGDCLGNLQLIRWRVMWLGVIQHQLAEHTGVQSQRDKDEGADFFPFQVPVITRQTLIARSIRHNQGTYIEGSGPPWRVSGDCGLVLEGETPGGLEPDHTIVVKKKNRCAIGGSGIEQARKRRLIYVFERFRLAQIREESIKGPEATNLSGIRHGWLRNDGHTTNSNVTVPKQASRSRFQESTET